MPNEKLNIVIIAKNEAARREYEKRVAALGVNTFTFGSFKDFQEKCGRELYNGIIVDLKTILGSSRDEKRLTMDLESSFPMLRIINNVTANRISGIADDLNLEGDEVFDIFVREKCAPFRPRGVRTSHRQLIHLSLKVFRDASQPVLANTYDVSKAGMFIVSTEKYEMESRVSFTVKEFEDQSPIQAIVKWVLPWGKTSRHLSGFGIEFVALSESQKSEIEVLTRPIVFSG
jgi:Tfp pilus assembly protein PilZ